MSIDPNKLRKAREWAKGIIQADSQGWVGPDLSAAAEVIRSLPDEWIDANKLRELVEKADDGRIGAGSFLERVQALLPAPQPRTLADMTPQEREACQWMQVEVYKVPCELGVITYLTEYHATVMWHDGTTTLRDHKELTPLPDLPRLEWPTSEPATEDTPEPAPTQPEDVPAGEVPMEEQVSTVGYGRIQHDDIERTHYPEGTIVRRFVTEWEARHDH